MRSLELISAGSGTCSRGEGGVMITVPGGIRVLIATKPVDFRKGADGLVALIREGLGHDSFSGSFSARNGRTG